MIATATKFTLKRWGLYGEFFVDTYRVVKQVRRAKGVMRLKVHPLTLSTLTVWKTQEDMLRFRNSGAHLHAMKKSDYFGSIVSVTWETETMPTWQEAMQRLKASSL